MVDTTKKKTFHFNIGIISFLLIFIYIIGHLVLSLSKEELAVYQVIQSRIHDSIRTTGLILRDESIVKAENNGYLNYYVNEGESVAKNGLVYTCDRTGEAHEYISNFLKQKDTLNSDDYESIKELLKAYEERYTDSNFSYVYDLKYQLENQAMKLGDSIMADYMDEIEASLGTGSFIKSYSKASGIVTYIEDGYENKTVEDLTLEDFITSEYKKKNLKTENQVGEGDSVFRLTKKGNWQLVLSITDNEYAKIKDKKKVTISLEEGKYMVSCPVEFIRHTEGYLAVLTMTNYLNHFVKDRYVEVEVKVKEEDGLKIPNTAIVEKEFYKIPKEYFTVKTDGKINLVIKKQDSKGAVSLETIEVKIAKSETDAENGKKYYYILKDEVLDHALISLTDSSETMLLDETVFLPGVYNINKGYADFRCIDPLIQNKDYTIVKAGVSKSISLFDRIVLNGNTIENNDIVY